MRLITILRPEIGSGCDSKETELRRGGAGFGDLLRRFVGDVDDAAVALGFFVELVRFALDTETGEDQPVGKGVILRGGPDGGTATGLERGQQELDAGRFVEPGVGLLDHRGRAVVDVEHERVVLAGFGAEQDVPDVVGEDGDARVVHELAVDRGEEFAVPSDDLRDQLGDVDAGVAAGLGEDAAQTEPHAQAADEDAGRGRMGQPGDGEFAEVEFGGGHRGVHQGLAVEADGVVAVVFAEGQAGAIARGRFGEFAFGFHRLPVGADGLPINSMPGLRKRMRRFL